MPARKVAKTQEQATSEETPGPSDASPDVPTSGQPAENEPSASRAISPSTFYSKEKKENNKQKRKCPRKQRVEKVARIAHASEDVFGFDESTSDSEMESEREETVLVDDGNGGGGGEVVEAGGGEGEVREDDGSDGLEDGDMVEGNEDEAVSMDEEDPFPDLSDSGGDSDGLEEQFRLYENLEFSDVEVDSEDDDDSAPFDMSMEFFSDVAEEDSSDEESDLPDDPFEREILGSVVEPEKSLHMAVIKGDSKTLGRWRAWGTGLWAHREEGDTDLHCAARSGDVSTVEQLIHAGARLSRFNRKRHTPLEVAALCGHASVVKTLLTNGLGNDTEQMEHALLATKSSAVVEALAEANPILLLGVTGVDVLTRAARDGRVLVLQALLKGGADANWPGTFNRTALHTAASRGHVRCVSALLENNADVTSVDDRLWTPLHYAAYHTHRECVRVLIAAGADPNAKSGEGQMPFDVAFDDTIQKLLKNA